MKKVILDIDTGIDDSLALAYLIGSKEVEILGVTTTFGNVFNDTAYHNTVNLLALLGHGEIPVYRGAEHPLLEEVYKLPPKVKVIHGENGIGNVILPEVHVPEKEIRASDFFVEAAEKYGGDLIIVAVGAMTNLALAYQKNSEAIRKVGRIVMMGGALTVPGNCSPFAEANFRADPEAAKLLLESELNIVMVGLDVTLTTLVTEQDIAPWEQIDSPAAHALTKMCRYYYANEADEHQVLSGCLHDPLAVEVAINPEVVTGSLPIDLTVETEGLSIGRSIGNKHRIQGGIKNTEVCLEVKAEEFVKKFSKRVLSVL